MNAADTALTAGFTELLATAGDSVTFRGLPVSAVVLWISGPDNQAGQFPAFDPDATASIEVRLSALKTPPKVGESFVTEGPRYHRIKTVRFTGYSWRCDCETIP